MAKNCNACGKRIRQFYGTVMVLFYGAVVIIVF